MEEYKESNPNNGGSNIRRVTLIRELVIYENNPKSGGSSIRRITLIVEGVFKGE